MIYIRSLIRLFVIFLHKFFLKRIYGMRIDNSARISFGAKLDKVNPRGVSIGEESYIASGAFIFTHDFSRGLHLDTTIGKRCFIGANAIVMCGITIGDEVVVGAGTVVTKNIPSNCIVVGNPARIIKRNIKTVKFGQIISK